MSEKINQNAMGHPVSGRLSGGQFKLTQDRIGRAMRQMGMNPLELTLGLKDSVEVTCLCSGAAPFYASHSLRVVV